MCMFNTRMGRPSSGWNPQVELAQNYELSGRQLATALRLVRKHKDEISAAWEKHFGGRGK